MKKIIKKSQKISPALQPSIMLLSLGIITVLAALFVNILLTKSEKPSNSSTTVQPIVNALEIDLIIKDLDKFDTTDEIDVELGKLTTDSAGI